MTVPFRGSASEHTRQQLRAKRFERLSRDVYLLRGEALDLRGRALAAQLVLPDAVPCGRTAALLLRLPVDDDGFLHLARGTKAARSERRDVTVHRLALRADELHDVDGLRVTSGPRTLTDLASEREMEDLVSVGDVVTRRWGHDAVLEAVARANRRRGATLLRHALPLFDPGSDSPAETRARLRLHAAGSTTMRHKVVVRDELGGWLGVPDLADPIARVAWQHEGEVHFTKGVKQRRKDLDRDELLRAQG